MTKLLLIFIGFLMAILPVSAAWPADSLYEEWQSRNSHLIPNHQEQKAILLLNQAYAQNWRSPHDADGDGVPNSLDPSPLDWREKGYDPFGVLEFLSWNHDWNSHKYEISDLEKIVALMKEAGVGMVRFDFLWQDIEPAPGEYHFEKYDKIVNLLTENQIRILGLVAYSAGWAGASWNSPPENDATFVRYARKVIQRYKNRVKYWEVWNEPDSRTYWTPQDDMKRYTRLLKKVYKAAKSEDPSCKIVLGGLTSSGYFALKSIYREGGKDSFDVANIHPFVDPLSPDRKGNLLTIYRNVRRVLDQNGDQSKKIWFSEIGAPGVKERTRGNGWWEGESPTEEEQARWVRDIYEEFLALDVEKIFWAFFRDNLDHFKNGVDYFGLLRWDFSAKPSFDSYQREAQVWHKAWKNYFRSRLEAGSDKGP